MISKKSMSLLIALIMSINAMPMANENSEQMGTSPSGTGGLADSPWPMFRHNLNHTGFSPQDTSGNQGDLRWSFTTGYSVGSSPAIGSDGTIYVGSYDYNLYAINPDGSRKWNFATGLWVISSPAIGSDGTIYVGSDDNGLHAINPDGTEKWCFGTSSPFESSPAIGSDGIIYAGNADGALYAINPDGTENWNYYDLGAIRSSPSIGSDGTIYVGSQDSNLYAINSDGTLRWLFSTDRDVQSSPAIGPDGTIYVGSWDGKLYAINPDGSKKWDFATGSVVESSPAIGPDGTIYVGSWDGKLYAINPDGSEKWSFTTDSYVRSSPAIGSDGSVYVGSDDYKLYAVNPDGSERWNFTTGNVVRSSPAIGSDGTIYVGSWDDKLYAIGLSQNQPPVADAGPDQTVFEGDTVTFDGTGSYDPDGGGDWSPKATIPSPRGAGAATVLNGEIYYVGGNEQDLTPGPSSIFQKYNPATDSWSDLPDLPEPSVYLGTATVGGKIYATGGSNGTHSSNNTYEFDLASNNWTSKAPIPIPMEAFGTVVVNDKIYLVGGWSTFVYCYPCAFVFEYDPSTDSWSQKKDIPTGRAKLATTVLNGKIFAIGGHPTTVSPVVEVYDPATEEWSRRTNLTTGRWSLSAEVLGGNIYAFGGIVNWDLATDVNEMYDPATDRWTSEPSMLDIRMDFGSGVVGDCIYAVGGYRGFMAGHPNRSEEYCLGGDLTYEWDFDANVDSDGDGDYTNDKEATGPTPTHVFYDDGVYTVTLTVTDTQGLQDTDQCNITVLNVPPTPQWTSRSVDGSILNPPYPEGKEILFEATVYDPGIYDTFTYDWNFGDGTILLDGGPSVIHAYGDNETYIVVLKVTDDDGGVGIDDTPPLLTTNEDPVASISIPRCPFFEGGPACPMDGFFTDPGWLDTHSAVWDFGDGEYEIAVITEENEPPDATGMNSTSHVYGDNGVYNVTFTVVDDDGGTDTALAWASPYNLPPSITVDIPSSVSEGEHFNLGITATDPGSDDLFINIDWGDGTSESETYYNNGVGPDPPNSGPGVFPFKVHANFSHVYGDDSNFTITVRVEDDDGGLAFDETVIVVENVPPTIEYFDYFFNASFAFRIAGEKWHNVEYHLFEDGTEIGNVNITRYPGSPDDQMAHLADVSVDFSKRYSAIAYYTPMDDPINGQIWGATPAWVIMSYEDGSEERIHHTFNVRHEDTWTWVIDDLSVYFLGHNITFVATALDPGSDDLTFTWDWGDGNTTEHIYYNDGVGPDPYPSPDVNPITVTDTVQYSYVLAGTYTITLKVTDDDGGQATISIVLSI